MTRPAVLSAVAYAAAMLAAAALPACGPAAGAPTAGDPAVRFHGTAGPEFTGVAATVLFRVPEPTPGCRRRSPSSGEWLREEARLTEGAEVVDGRFEVVAPLRWPERSPCDFRPTEVFFSFARGGRRGDPDTGGALRIDLGGPPPDDGRGPAFFRAPLPDSARVRCLLVRTVREVPVQPVHCGFVPPEDGVWGELPVFVVPDGQGRTPLNVAVDVRLDPLYSDDVGWNGSNDPRRR